VPSSPCPQPVTLSLSCVLLLLTEPDIKALKQFTSPIDNCTPRSHWSADRYITHHLPIDLIIISIDDSTSGSAFAFGVRSAQIRRPTKSTQPRSDSSSDGRRRSRHRIVAVTPLGGHSKNTIGFSVRAESNSHSSNLISAITLITPLQVPCCISTGGAQVCTRVVARAPIKQLVMD